MAVVVMGSGILSTTDDWLLESRRLDAPLVALIKISLVSPTPRTLYLSSAFVETPDWNLWEAGVVKLDGIRSPGRFLSPGLDPCTADFSLASRHGLGFQPAGENITNLFVDYRWLGAKVEIYTWSKRLTNRTPELLFSGIVQNYSVQSDVCEVRCIQRQDANRIVSPEFVTRDKYPRAPDRSVGLPIPIIYGSIKGPPFRAPWPNPFGTDQNAMDACQGGQLGVSCVTVDTGRGGTNQKQEMRLAAHAVKSHATASDSTQYFIRTADRLSKITPSETFNGAGGAGIRVADDFGGAVVPIGFSQTSTVGSGGGHVSPENTSYLIDPFDERSFCRVRGGVNVAGVLAKPESISPAGLMAACYVRVAYRSTGSLTTPFYVYSLKGTTTTNLGTLAASTTPTVVRLSLGTVWGNPAMPDAPWDFGQLNIGFKWNDPSIDSTGTANEYVDLIFLGIEVECKPDAKVYRLAEFSKPKLRIGRGVRAIEFQAPREIVPADTEIEAPFFASVDGIADDGSGTYTGTASALVERPCDIAHHLLRNYGAQDSGQVQAGDGVFGSFRDGRSIKTWRLAEWRAALMIAESSDLETQLRRIAEAGLGWIYLDRFSDRWHWVPWFAGTGVDYGRKVYRDDLIEFATDTISAGGVPSGIRIPFAWDGARREFIHGTYVSRVGSRAGYLFSNVRDEYLTVVAGVNDRLDVDVAGTPYNQTLAAGSYSDDGLLAEIQKINLLVNPVSVAFGGRIVTGVNDRIHLNDGASKTAILAAGLYSMEALAVQVAAAMNAVSSNWSCSYSRSTRKFTVSRSSGTAQLSFGANTETAAALGFYNDAHTAGSPYVSDFAVEEDLISYSASFTFSLKFASGTNGTEQAAPKSCADLLGFDGRFDTDAAKYAQAVSPKGNLETVLDQAAAAYGQTRELVIEGRALYDSETARELRNRLVALLKEPRVVVRWKTTRMPDLHRGELVRFDDLDNFGLAFPKQASDGLWTGKRFRVLSMVQRLGPSFEQEIEAIESD